MKKKKLCNKKGRIIPSRFELPVLEDDDLKYLSEQIKPVVTYINEKCFVLDIFTLKDLKTRRYWDTPDYTQTVSEKDLDEVEEFLCVHYEGDPLGIPQPTIAEILAQIPLKTIREADVFELLDPISISNEERDKYADLFWAGYHVNKVKTYKIIKK